MSHENQRIEMIDGLLLGIEILSPTKYEPKSIFELTLDNHVVTMSMHQASCLNILIGDTLATNISNNTKAKT